MSWQINFLHLEIDLCTIWFFSCKMTDLLKRVRLSFAGRGYLGKRNGIKRGIIVKEGKPQERLLSRGELLEATSLSAKALKKYEEAGFVSAEKFSGGINYYSEETVEIINAMEQCLGRCANLQEAYQIAHRGMISKKRRRGEADSSQLQTMDPKDIKTHPSFEGILSIEEDLAENLTADMAVEGYYLSIPIVLATWPGQEEPVLIDGHTRVRAAVKAGVHKIPYVVETFDDLNGTLEYIAKVQTQRRSTDDWIRYQLIGELDCLMDRGGDRRSEQAKSKGPHGPIETKPATSAERTAGLVGCSARTVKRARRIRKDGSTEILEALRNRKMTISQAEKALTKKIGEESRVGEKESFKVHLTAENLAALRQLEGPLNDHVNKAVSGYIRWLRKKGRFPEEKQ